MKDKKKKEFSDNKILKEYGIGAQILTDLGVKKNQTTNKLIKKYCGYRRFWTRNKWNKNCIKNFNNFSKFYQEISDNLIEGATKFLESQKIVYET